MPVLPLSALCFLIALLLALPGAAQTHKKHGKGAGPPHHLHRHKRHDPLGKRDDRHSPHSAHVHYRREHRAPSPDQQAAVGWSDAAPLGWNRGEALVGTIRRIPLMGLHSVSRDAAQSANAPNLERADRRAVVLLPRDLSPDLPVEVLLHLHGYHNGYRQELSGTRADPIRDRDVDRIEAQMEQAGRAQLIAVLPQGSCYSDFAPPGARVDKTFDSDDLIDEVLARLQAAQVLSARPEVQRVIVSAHSGGGEPLGLMLEHADLAPETLSAVAFFDAINGPRDELPRVERWLMQRLTDDLLNLRDLDEEGQARYLSASLRFRAYHTPGGHYGPLHDAPTVRFSDPALLPLRQFLDAWFHDHEEELGGAESQAARGLRDHYQVLEVPGVSHDAMVGTGILRDVLKSLPPPAAPEVATTSAD